MNPEADKHSIKENVPSQTVVSGALNASLQPPNLSPANDDTAKKHMLSSAFNHDKVNKDDAPSKNDEAIGKWIHRHKDLPQKSFLGFTAYQYIRSALASIPYGISMATTLAAFTKLDLIGKSMQADTAASGFKKSFGARLSQFSTFNAFRVSALVATSFTLYRGTSKLVKWLTEYLFNPKDSEQRTIEKVHDLPSETIRKVKEIAPAEVSSTPVAALVLGFVTHAFNKAGVTEKNAKGVWELKNSIPNEIDWVHKNFKDAKGWSGKWGALKNALFHPKARLLEQSLIFGLGYSLFFELGDRLFKDKQIRRGVWAGENHSIKALKATPDDFQQGIEKQQEESQKGKYADSARAEKPNHEPYSAFTQEPSLTRFALRRVLPTMAGIAAYSAFKFRHAYMLMGDFAYNAKEPLLKQLPKIALIEGVATSLFFIVPFIAEPWEKMYDSFFSKLQKKANDNKVGPENVSQQPVPEHIQKNFAALSDALDKKEALSHSVSASR